MIKRLIIFKKNQTELTVESIEQTKASCLKTLHKVTSRDDLISQMFQTGLEDDCLYHFTSAELENIWGIPVLDYVEINPMLLPTPPNKDIESPIGLYIEIHAGPKAKEIYVRMTLSELNKNFSIFPEGHFPSILPSPESLILSEAALLHPPKYVPPYKSPPQAKIKAGKSYYWINGERAVEVTSRVGEVAYLCFVNYRSYTSLSDESLARQKNSQ